MTATGGSELGHERALPPEELVRVELDDRASLIWACTPSDLKQLVAGWLACEGIARSRDEITSLDLDQGPAPYAACVRVRLAPKARERLERAHSHDPGTALGPWTPARLPASGSASPRVPPEVRDLLADRTALVTLFREMFSAAALRARVGGVHTGGLVSGGRLRTVVEDVSRHHVVDRLVGSALLAGTKLEPSVLLLSARISGAMAAKGCRAGVGALVTRSVPTGLAVRVAEVGGLALVGRARREQPHYFWPGTEVEP